MVVSPDTRTRLLGAAKRLIHQQGFAPTTLAGVAATSKVPLGNIYYHFRTKQALADAVIAERAEEQRALRAEWDRLPGPRARLLAFVRQTAANGDSLARHGCPIGGLCLELHKLDGRLAGQAAAIFGEILAWLEAQFSALDRGKEARDLAAHLLSSLEGAALLANSFGDARYVAREAERLSAWIGDLERRAASRAKGAER